MTAHWAFNRHRPGERARNSQVEKFFRSDEVTDRTTPLVREGIQNTLDAATKDSVNVCISKVGGCLPSLAMAGRFISRCINSR